MTSPLGEKDALVRLPEIPDDDSDFTPELARKIVARYQEIIRSLAALTPAAPEGEGRSSQPVGVTVEEVARTMCLHCYSGATFDDCTPDEQATWLKAATAILSLLKGSVNPRSIDREALVRLSASEHACYRWPEDTAEQNYRDGLGPDGEK